MDHPLREGRAGNQSSVQHALKFSTGPPKEEHMVIGLIVAGAWISLTIVAVALCRIAGRAEAPMAVVMAGDGVAREALRALTPTQPARPGRA
jgi:hypothetical protein